MKRHYLTILITLLSSCAGGKFVVPEVELPENYSTSSHNHCDSLSLQEQWWMEFNDPNLNSLITTALDSNYNLEATYCRIIQARLELTQSRSQSAPTLDLEMEAGATYTAGTKTVQSYSIKPAITWEIDLFGKLRNASEAQLSELFATEANYQALRLSLCAEVATTYFSILEYNLAIDISQKTLLSRENSLKLFEILADYGEISDITLQQNRSLVASAKNTLEGYQLQRTKSINALCTLLNTNPEELNFEGISLLYYTLPEPIPVGLPCQLLNRRADIVEAYYNVKTAYSNIAVAIANRFPSITLTGSGGLVSSSLSALFSGNPWGWSSSLGISEPIFAFGRNKRMVELAKIERDATVLSYEQTVVSALNEVRSALYGVESYREQTIAMREVTASNKIAMDLSSLLYDAGSDSYLDLLDAQRSYFASQLELASTLFEHLNSYITLYKALGGGYYITPLQ